MLKIFLGLVFFGGIVFLGLSWVVFHGTGSSLRSTPEETFQSLLFNPIPEDVRNLEVGGENMQGHTIYIKFVANEGIVKRMITLHNYESVDCNSIQIEIIPSEVSSFWDVQNIKNSQCYRADGYTNAWTSNGYSQFLFDVTKNTVYFHEIGI